MFMMEIMGHLESLFNSSLTPLIHTKSLNNMIVFAAAGASKVVNVLNSVSNRLKAQMPVIKILSV